MKVSLGFDVITRGVTRYEGNGNNGEAYIVANYGDRKVFVKKFTA